MKRWQRVLVIAGGAVAVLAVLVVAFGAALLRAVVSTAGHAAGYGITYRSFEHGPGRLEIVDPNVTGTRDEPLFTARRIVVAYNLWDAFRKPYLYGVHGIELDQPKLTIIHHKDGSYNFVLPKRQGPTKPPTIPRIRLLIRDGSIGVIDRTRLFLHSRRLSFEDIRFDADVDPQRSSRLRGGLAVLETGGRFPLALRGTLDEVRGYEDTHITAQRLALAPLFDFAINSRALHVAYGMLLGIDAHVYGLRDKTGRMQRHLSITANLDHFQPYVNGIAKPLRDGRGYLQVNDGMLAIPKVDGSIAGVPIRIAGAIYGLQNPHVHLGITGRGDLRRLITLSDAAKRFPLSGPVAFELLVEGSAVQPLSLVRFASPGITYRGLPLDEPGGLVALQGQVTSILQSTVGYDGLSAGARGTVVLGKRTYADLLAHVSAPVARLPYGADTLGSMVLDGTLVARGTNARLQSAGEFGGATAAQRLFGTLAVNGNGEGTVGPILLQGPGNRSVYARVALDRPHAGGGAAFVTVRGFRLRTHANEPSLPGLALPRAPAVAGTLEGALAGAFAGRRFAVGGNGTAHDVVAMGFPFDQLTFRGTVGTGGRVEARVRVRGSLAALARAAGKRIKATGYADIPIDVVANGPRSIVAQIGGARFSDASVGGVPLRGVGGTIVLRDASPSVASSRQSRRRSNLSADPPHVADDLPDAAALDGKEVDVYAARLQLGRENVIAQGSFGAGGTLGVSAANVDLAALRRAGLPLEGGTLTALARIGGSLSDPFLDAGITASGVRSANARLSGVPVDAGVELHYGNDTVIVRDGNLVAGPAVGSLHGTIGNLRGGPHAARYDLQASIEEADIGTFANLFNVPQYPEGTLRARARVVGRGTSAAVTGRVAIPEGSLNGLAYRNAAVSLAGTAEEVRARDGTVTVGSSTIAFSAHVSRRAQRIVLRAPRVDLSDFNDYFNVGDTLGGRGSFTAALDNTPDRISLDAGLYFRGTRFRRFDFGDARGEIVTRGRKIDAAVALGGAAGLVSGRGSVTFPERRPLHDALRRTLLSIDARVRHVDLGVWLPAAGLRTTVLGNLDADARVAGRYPDLVARAHAGLSGALIKGVAVRTATLDARAAGRRVTISRAILAIDNFGANLSGTVKLRPNPPFALALSAQTPDVGALAHTLTGKTYDAAGTIRTTAQLTGTVQTPLLRDAVDAKNLRYGRFTLPHAHADVAITRTHLDLHDAGADLASGNILAAGSVPLRTGIRPGIASNAPLSFRLAAHSIGLGQFAALFANGTKADGMIDGSVTLGGSVANPALAGTVALTDADFSGPMLKSKITDAAAHLTFAGTGATLHDTSAKVGGGTIVATGAASVPSLRRPAHDLRGRVQVVLNDPVLDAPAFFRGRVGGTVDIVRAVDAPITVAGNVAFNSTRIPLSAIFNPRAPTVSKVQPLPLALDLNVAVERDVRVQGGPVDVGGTGNLHVGGTLAAPQLRGVISTVGGGTFNFYRNFVVADYSTIRFHASDGIIPTVDINATTTVPNPPTNVSLHITGPATQLNVDLASDPPYSRQQILGLLIGVQALGAVNGVQTAQGGSQQSPFQALAMGQLGTLLTQNIFEPFSSQVGGALGLSNLAFTYLPGSGASLGAARKLSANVSIVFAESFNYPQRQSVGLRLANARNTTAAQLVFFSQPGVNKFAPIQLSAFNATNQAVTDTEPANGGQGVSFSLQRKF